MARKCLRAGLLVLVLSLCLLPVAVVRAATTVQVTITAMGYICEAPGGLTLTYVSDNELGLSWLKGEDAENTLIRKCLGRYPNDRNDGIQVYYGTGTSCGDWVNIGTSLPVYYRAWSQRVDGLWEETGISGLGDFMSTSFLFMGLIILSTILTFIALKANLILFRLAASASWLSLGIWLLIGDVTNLSMSSTWTQVLGLVFLMMTVAPLTLQMVTEVRREGRGRSWVEWGKKPAEEKVSRSVRAREEYRAKLRRKLGR